MRITRDLVCFALGASLAICWGSIAWFIRRSTWDQLTNPGYLAGGLLGNLAVIAGCVAFGWGAGRVIERVFRREQQPPSQDARVEPRMTDAGR
jgi:hypothetical protein